MSKPDSLAEAIQNMLNSISISNQRLAELKAQNEALATEKERSSAESETTSQRDRSPFPYSIGRRR